MSEKILHKELSYKIYGHCFKVHNELGPFRSEKTYADFLEQLFVLDNVCFEREKPLPSSFEGEHAGRNIPDFVIEDKVILDVKSKRIISKEDYYQMKRYLSASGLDLGLIVNFRQKYLAPKRVLG
jgi:GxxExxY protein